jgi:polar amino acid transport system substrate-binding protein
VVTKNPSIQKFKDLTNRKIAVLNHSSNIDQVKYFIPEAKLIGVNSYAEARSRLESNTVDAVAADASILAGWVQTYPQYQLIPYKLSATPLAVVMAKGLQYDEFRRKVNEAIARYTVTGWLKKSIQKWELP